MSKLKKAGRVISSLIRILFAIALFINPVDTYPLVVVVLSVSLILYGLSMIWFYITMARHMVGGQMTLYEGLAIFDLGMVSIGLVNIPSFFMILYLAVIHGLSGVFCMLRVNEARNYGGSWKFSFFSGVANLLIAILCIICIKNAGVAVYVYAIGLVYSSVFQLISTFRKTEVVYIQ